MKKQFIVFGCKTFTETNLGFNTPVLNAEASGANAHTAAAIGY